MTSEKRVTRVAQWAIYAMCATFAPIAGAEYVAERNGQEQGVANKNAKLVAAMNAVKGKTFWYRPNPKANARIDFIEPDPSGALPNGHDTNMFSVKSEISFVIYGYLLGKYNNYYLKVRFPNGKVGLLRVNPSAVMDPAQYPVIANLYPTDGGRTYEGSEYIYARPPQEEILLAEKNAATQQAAKEMKQKTVAIDLRDEVRIGMSAKQALDSNWGKPLNIRRTTTASGTQEQWVYGDSKYLYFDNGLLTVIQH